MNWKKILYLFGWFVYSIIFIGRKWGYFLPELFNSYLTDLLCIPLCLASVQWTIQKIKKQPELQLTPYMVAFSVAYFSVVFECWLPSKNSIYTADVWDVVCYCLGGVIFLYIQLKTSNLLMNKLRD